MRSRAGESAPMAATHQDEQNQSRRLQFTESLSWRVGRPTAVTELLKRLTSLSKEMNDLDQEEIERDSLNRVAAELVNPNLLAHKDQGIRAWTACCLVDILRLYAPDAPYTGPQLKEVFRLFISSILPALVEPSHPYNQQHLFVLSSLAQIKSIILLTDIPDSEKMVTNLFITTFDMLADPNQSASGEQITKNVEYNLTEILIIIVDESNSLPPEVIDVIVAQFLRADPHIIEKSFGPVKGKKGSHPLPDKNQSTLQMKELPPSYNLAKTVCNTCSEKMARHISQYFNDIIVDASDNASKRNLGKRRRLSEDLESSDLDATIGPSEEDLRELSKAHLLLRELWRACPSVLQNVVPQLEAELSAENVHLRQLATETFGDMISGISAAGCPASVPLDPSKYPYLHLSDSHESLDNHSVLLKPCSPLSFSRTYSQAFQAFLNRRLDKSPLIRAAWTTGICRILRTSAGGVGLSSNEETTLIQYIPIMLKDSDDKVRLAAVRAVGSFSFADVVLKLGALGGIETSGSVMNVLAERVRDLRHNVRTEAMMVLSRLWGVAAGEIEAGNDKVTHVLGAAPSVIFATYYTNDPDIHLLIDRAVFENLLPLTFPPQKSKKENLQDAAAQNGAASDVNGETSLSRDPDKVRAERILLLARGLDSKSKDVFCALQSRQLNLARAVGVYVSACEEYNGGVVEKNEKEVKNRLSRIIDSLCKGYPDSLKAREALWKLAKLHDRRIYTLLRFSIAPESEFVTIFRATRELRKRLEAMQNSTIEVETCLVSLLYRVSPLIYNRSHVPAIMQYSRASDDIFSKTANEMLKDISTRTPEILSAQIQDLCKHLQENAPVQGSTSKQGFLNDLKACASFAKQFPSKIPKERKFIDAMKAFALFGAPPETGKHAATIIMACSDKKELLAKALIPKCCEDFDLDQAASVTRLATLSQLVLLAPEQANLFQDTISDIAIRQTLQRFQDADTLENREYVWSATMHDECEAKCWALKTLVNQVRSHADEETLSEVAEPVLTMLSTLVSQLGELSSPGDGPQTPPAFRSRLRLSAARSSLKLCLDQPMERLFTPTMFNGLSLVLQDSLVPVRSLFLQRLKKYLNLSKLPKRFYTLPFLLAFEPVDSLRTDTLTWLRSRTIAFHNQQPYNQKPGASIIMEGIFARLLSMLAHHPDFTTDEHNLADFAKYILFYLHPVASEDNLSLIFHIAQRVKQMQDAIPHTSEQRENLYYLSDLAQLTIRKFEDAQKWSMQTQPAKATLPKSLFVEIKDHAKAQKIADRVFISEGLEDRVEAVVKASMRAVRNNQSRKRKSESEDILGSANRDTKKTKTLPLRKTPASREKKTTANGDGSHKSKKQSVVKSSSASVDTNVDRRRSGRVKNEKSLYQERDDELDDEEMMDGVAEWTYMNENGDEVEVSAGQEEDAKANASEAVASSPAETVKEDEWKMPDSPPPSKQSPARKKAGAMTKAPPKKRSKR